jgi:hypothetical protein
MLVFTEGCDGSSSRLATRVYHQPSVLDAGFSLEPVREARAAAPMPALLPDWCGSERDGSLDAAQFIDEIVGLYSNAQRASCAGLTAGMLDDQLASWWVYLNDYTRVMLGCVDLVMPPPGGILEFGPANTAAVGVSHAPLSRADAALLIGAYLSAFAGPLSLAAEDRALVEAHLWRSAEPHIDPSRRDGLALCASVSPTGPDAGADAGPGLGQ